MNLPDIDFTRIRSLGPGGQRDGFEQFICQQVAQEPFGMAWSIKTFERYPVVRWEKHLTVIQPAWVVNRSTGL